MREFITSASLLGSLLIYMLVMNVPETVLMFVLFGIVPGSENVLSPLEMQQVWLGIAVIMASGIVGPRLASYLTASNKETA